MLLKLAFIVFCDTEIKNETTNKFNKFKLDLWLILARWRSLVDRGVQTPTSLSANSPRMLQLKRKLKSLDAALRRLRQRQQRADNGTET